MSREAHVQFWKGLGVEIPGATYQHSLEAARLAGEGDT